MTKAFIFFVCGYHIEIHCLFSIKLNPDASFRFLVFLGRGTILGFELGTTMPGLIVEIGCH
jgi:hypothetical protein